MRLNNLTILALVSLAAVSCTNLRPIEDFSVDELVSNTSYQRSEFDLVGTLQGIEIRQSEISLFKNQNSSVRMRSFISNVKTTHQLYFQLTYTGSDWRFYDGINLSGGDYYETRSITRDVLSCASSLGCTYWEVLTLDLDTKLLQTAVNSGLKFRLRSRYSDTYWDYSIPANVFIAQTTAAQSYQGNF